MDTQQLADIEACRALIVEFAARIDSGQAATLGELLTVDASFARPTAPDVVISGREAILVRIAAENDATGSHALGERFAALFKAAKGPGGLGHLAGFIFAQGIHGEAGAEGLFFRDGEAEPPAVFQAFQGQQLGARAATILDSQQFDLREPVQAAGEARDLAVMTERRIDEAGRAE